MRRGWTYGASLLYALYLALPSIALASDTGALPRLTRTATILAFGDSLTFGIGGSGDSYPQQLARLIDREVINAGVPGDTTADGRARLKTTLHDVRPSLLILCLGVNDFLRHVPSEDVLANLGAMLALADEAGVPVLLLAVPAPGAGSTERIFAGFAQTGSVLVDRHAMVDVLKHLALKADLVHPNREGYRQVAQAIAQRLRESGALPAP